MRGARVTADPATGLPGGGRAGRAGTPSWLWIALGLLFLLRHDVWFWTEPRLVLGLPAGLLYHVVYCLAVAAVMALAVRRAWPPPGAADGDLAGDTRR